ncbi:MAG: thioredoxin [Spirochaetaceae bacterium]|nr:thioredoxin [Spirochaetaceae bacterium]
MGAEINVTRENFEEVVKNSDIPVIIDFWAEWCVPCKMIGPVLEEISEEYKGKLKVAKVNVDEAGELASEYSVISIPTLMVFNKGEMVKQQVGAVSRQVIEGMFTDIL